MNGRSLKNQNNPHVQCSVCGQWKRLTRTAEGTEKGMQTFYPCCGDQGQFEHIKPVCHKCCTTKCPYNPAIITPYWTMVAEMLRNRSRYHIAPESFISLCGLSNLLIKDYVEFNGNQVLKIGEARQINGIVDADHICKKCFQSLIGTKHIQP